MAVRSLVSIKHPATKSCRFPLLVIHLKAPRLAQALLYLLQEVGETYRVSKFASSPQKSSMTPPAQFVIANLRESISQRMNNNKDEYWNETIGEDYAQEAVRVCEELYNDDSHLQRILVARKFDETQSTDLFFEQIRFRARYKPTEIDPSSIPNALASGAWRLCGYDRRGHVISNYKLSKWDPHAYANGDQEEGVQEYVRYVLYMIELMIGSMTNQQQFVVLFDLKGFSPRWVFQQNVRLMIRKLIYVAQAQYPERLYKVLLTNAPYGFETAWSLIKPLLDEKTAAKIHFCSEKAITNDIESQVLCVDYGGTHDEYPIPTRSLDEELKLASLYCAPVVAKESFASETEDESASELGET